MGAECVCDPENGGKREGQLLDALITRLLEVPAPAAGGLLNPSDLYTVLHGDKGDPDGGLVGKIGVMEINQAELKTGLASISRWVKVSVAIYGAMLLLLVSHLAEQPRSANADAPPVMEQTTNGP